MVLLFLVITMPVFLDLFGTAEKHFLRLKTGQERWHPKWQTTLQMRVLSQAFQRWVKAIAN